MKDAKAKSLMDDVVVNSVSPHAMRRCIERRLPLDALAGHARGVTTVFSRSGRTITVYPRSSRCSLVPGHFELGDRLEFPAALVRDTYAFGVPNDDVGVAVDATGAIQHVIGKRGRAIKRMCVEHGVYARVYGGTVLISGPGAARGPSRPTNSSTSRTHVVLLNASSVSDETLNTRALPSSAAAPAYCAMSANDGNTTTLRPSCCAIVRAITSDLPVPQNILTRHRGYSAIWASASSW